MHLPSAPPDSSSGQSLVSFQFSGDWCSPDQWGGFDIKPLRLFSTCVPRLWSMASSQDGEWSPDWTSPGIRMLNNCPLNRGNSWIIHTQRAESDASAPGPVEGAQGQGTDMESLSTSQSQRTTTATMSSCVDETETNKTNINADILLLERSIKYIFQPVISPTFLSGWMSYSHSWCSTLTFWITSQRLQEQWLVVMIIKSENVLLQQVKPGHWVTGWSQFGETRAPSVGFALKMHGRFLPRWPFKCPWIHWVDWVKYAYLVWMH